VEGVTRAFGNPGLQLAGAALGLTDVDALTISMTTTANAATAPAGAAMAIVIGIAANCAMKTALAVGLGAATFGRKVGAVLAAMTAAIVIVLGVMR